jgi:vacuolar iron transporter family protein
VGLAGRVEIWMSDTSEAGDIRRALTNLKLERDAVVLYDQLAAIDEDPKRKSAFTKIASNERRHADVWQERLKGQGIAVPDPGPARPRVRFVVLLARLFGTRYVADMVRAIEGDEEELYLSQDDPEVAAIIDDERLHAEIWRQLKFDPRADLGIADTAGTIGHASSGAVGPVTVNGVDLTSTLLQDPGTTEAWHRRGQSGTLRATIFGVSDGLVSNLSLVMGVVGAKADNHVIVLAGVAGMLAGAISMGAGEWVSMKSQKELFERQLELEREEMRVMPHEEELELAAVYHRRGVAKEEALVLAHRLMADPEAALDVKAREELGLDPDELGSPWGAAAGSLIAFGSGAFVPLVPFLVSSGTPAFLGAVILSAVALFAVGAGVSVLTGRNTLFSALRQVVIGAFAAGVTYLVGVLVGVSAS